MALILIVEDEKRLLRTLRDGLAEAGYEVVTSNNGEAALWVVQSQPVDLVVLDLMLPGLHGLEVLQRLRNEGFAFPVLILTACDQVRDRVAGLDRGADDYLVKPFSYVELLARLRVLLRRGPPRAQLELSAGELRLNLLQRRAYRGETELELSRREFDLLEYLLQHRGQTVSREMLARDIWRDSQTLITNVIDVFVNRLRRKLDRPGDMSSHIQTVRGAGYLVPGEKP
ncbi:MAG: response regulator transcription factor [Planctomycetaceae bacterium]